MNHQVYHEINSKLRRMAFINVKLIMAQLEAMPVHGSTQLEAKRRVATYAKHVAPQSQIINLNCQRTGETTYWVNGERFGPKTEVEQFLDAADGVEAFAGWGDV